MEFYIRQPELFRNFAEKFKNTAETNQDMDAGKKMSQFFCTLVIRTIIIWKIQSMNP